MITRSYSKTGTRCRVTFRIPAREGASEAAILGEFNDWSPSAHRLARRRDGSLSITLSLPAGRSYRFRYLVDGARWLNDPDADRTVPNLFGTLDDVLELPERPGSGRGRPQAAKPSPPGTGGRARSARR